MAANGPEQQNINLKVENKDTFNGLDETIQKKGKDFVDALQKAEGDKNQEKTKAYADAFVGTGAETLKVIGDDMVLKFNSIDITNQKAPMLETYEKALKAFTEDITKLQIKDQTIINRLSDFQDIIDLKKINTINDKKRLNELKIVANLMKDKEGMNTKTTINLPGQKALEVGPIDLIEKEIDRKIKAITDKETEEHIKTTRDLLSVNYQTQEQAKGFFEKSQEADFNTTLKEVYDKNTGTAENNTKKIDKDPKELKEKSLVNMIKKYAASETIKDISIGMANENFCPSFDKGTRAVQFQKGTKLGKENSKITINGQEYNRKEITDEKGIKSEIITPALSGTGDPHIEDGVIYQKMEIVRGSQQEMQEKRANRTEKEDGFDKMRDASKGLNVFDGKGNYQAFKKFLDKQTPIYVQENMSVLADKIINYTAKSGVDANENINDLKNGYANVLNDYIVKNPSLLETYTTYLTTNNLNLLGTDKATRTANYNKLFFTDASKNTLRPEINDILSKFTNEADKKAFLTQIANIKSAIENTEKLTVPEMLSKEFDKLVEQFGPLLFGILKAFGFGKRSLLKLFPNAKDKINSMYQKEYGLSENARNAVNDIVKLTPESKNLRDDKKLPTGRELKEAFTDGNITTYIDKFKDIKYSQYINVAVLQQGVSLYDKNKNTNINDVVTLETDPETKKQTIKGIKDEETFKNVMKSILDNDATRSKISATHEEITKGSKAKVEGRGDNEYVNKEDDAYGYKIQNQQDIVRYLTASLFSNKDLAYVMTENGLNNGKSAPDTNKKDEKPVVVKENKEIVTPKLKIDAKYGVDANGVFTFNNSKDVRNSRIDMIFSDGYAAAPQNLLITHNGTQRKIEQGTAKILGKDIPTYVYSDNKSERVKIYTGDKIEAVAETPTETAEEKAIKEKYETIFTSVNKIGIDGKYEGFDVNTYIYSDNSSDSQKKYEKDILTPIKEITEITNNVTKINDKYFSDNPKLNQWIHVDNNTKTEKELPLDKIMLHTKNMLIMMGKNSIYKNITDNMKEGTKYSSGTNKNEFVMNNNDGTKIGTLKFDYIENTTDKKRTLNPTWTV